MNREHILTVAKQVMNKVEPVEENIYRGELIIQSEKPAGICFLDLTGNIFSLDEFKSYQEKLLADSFYESAGPLQWNYYLFMLNDKEKIDAELKTKIEKDDKYARKYIFDENEFEDFFSLETSEQLLSINIVLEWKKRLDIVGLKDVYGTGSYTQGVSDFLNNIPTKKSSFGTTNLGSSEEKLKSIDHILLKENYRKFPKKRSFKFGKVNLVKGTNGVGKTSLFEAIELLACGKNFRNKKTKEADACIEGFVNGKLVLSENCTPSKSEKYRLRDKFWYNNEYFTGNDCANSFNRFNFFNTDAATNLALSHTEKEVRQSLVSLVLGAEYPYILERMEGFRDRIRPEYNKLKEQLEQATKRISESTRIIEQFKNAENLNILRDKVAEQVNDLHFQNYKFENPESIPELEGLCNELTVHLQSFSRNSSGIYSLSTLNEQESVLDKRKASWINFLKNKEDIENKIRDQKLLVVKLEEKSALLTRALKYLADPRSFQLKELNNSLLLMTTQLKTIRSVRETIKDISINDFTTSENLQDLITYNTNELNIVRQNLLKADQMLQTSLARMDTLSQQMTQIKALGKQLVDADETIHTCPLCETNFTRNELLIRVNKELPNLLAGEQSIQILLKDQARLREVIQLHEKNLFNLKVLWSAFLLIDERKEQAIPISHVVSSISTYLAQENALAERQTEAHALEEFAKINSLSEEEFNSILEQLQLIEPTVSFNFSNKDSFKALLEQTGLSLVEARNILETYLNQKKVSGEEIKLALGLSLETEYQPSNIQQQLDNEAMHLSRFRQSFNTIGSIIRLETDTVADDLLLKITLLKSNIDTFKFTTQGQIELQRAEKDKVIGEQFLEKNIENINRIRKGFELLSELTASGSTDDMDKFFQGNLREINDIFRTIHAPREFREIKFEKDEISVVHESGEIRTVTQISTGQRSALALSVFLALHRKLKNGPDILIFDDPVSHIDDLNALSFLDFLRLFLLKENKQIFIGTANQRLASLIEKKFAFLDDNFQHFELTR